MNLPEELAACGCFIILLSAIMVGGLSFGGGM